MSDGAMGRPLIVDEGGGRNDNQILIHEALAVQAWPSGKP